MNNQLALHTELEIKNNGADGASGEAAVGKARQAPGGAPVRAAAEEGGAGVQEARLQDTLPAVHTG